MTALEWACRVVLGVLSAYHVVTGVVSVGFPRFSERFYQALYHFHPQMTEQYTLVLKPWGALALFAGVVGGFAAWDPERYPGVVLAVAGLLALRVGYRTVFAADMTRVFRVDRRRNTVNSVVMAAEVVLFAAWLVAHPEVW